MDRHLVAYFVGITLVFVINGMLLLDEYKRMGGRGRYAGFPNPVVIIYFFAGMCIVYYFMHREGYIHF